MVSGQTSTPYRPNFDPSSVEDQNLIILNLNKDNVREYMKQHDISDKKVINLQHDDNRTAIAFTDMADVQDILSDTDSKDDDTDIEDYLNDMWR